MVPPTSPRLASMRLSTFRERNWAAACASWAIPAGPNRSKKAAWGLTTARLSPTASRTVPQKRCRPAASLASPQWAKTSADGSSPRHRGERAEARAVKRSEKLSMASLTCNARRHATGDDLRQATRPSRLVRKSHTDLAASSRNRSSTAAPPLPADQLTSPRPDASDLIRRMPRPSSATPSMPEPSSSIRRR